MRVSSLCLLLYLLSSSNCIELHLTTSDEGYVTVIQGFAAELECTLNTCVRHSASVSWFKDDVLLFNSTKFMESSGVDSSSVLLRHNIELDRDKACTGMCSDMQSCNDGFHCRDNQCCRCSSEEFTLILKNLTFDDGGRYRCQISNQPQQLEFQVEVLESGLKGGFHESISYDYSECCQKKGISPLCQAMCKPKDMNIHHFDPTSCKTDDYKNFLYCATEGGNRSHVQCCKTQLVPSFCYDFCSGDFQMLRKSHRLCLYYLPEIFECYNRAYLPFPDPPQDVVVNAINSDQLRVCWNPPTAQSSNRHLDILHYTVFYKQIPSFPFLGGDDGVPLLSGDYEESAPNSMLDDEMPVEAIFSDSVSSIGGRRLKKRQTWLFVTHDSSSNDSTVREFKFIEINTTDTCLTLDDLRSATRYIVYLTATNAYGTSVPSSRAVAATNAVVSPSNASMPLIEKCCAANGVSTYCASKLCNVQNIPNTLETIAISTSCRTEWSKVSPCLANGRNHTDCCIRKGVQHDCLKICAGLPEPLSIHSLLCLNLDLAAIYQCLRQDYETHPSPPQNVTITGVTRDSVTVEWAEPAVNAHLVTSYSLFISKDLKGSEIYEVTNVTSPHVEYGLDPDTEYTVSLQSISAEGRSLMSTAEIFFTQSFDRISCPHGAPLFQPDDHRLYCGPGMPSCPNGYECTVSELDETNTFCCPKAKKEQNFVECCSSRGMSQKCAENCYYNGSFTSECNSTADIWVQCGSDGHDHTRCCVEFDIPTECIDACHHPFVMRPNCLKYVSLLLKCYSVYSLNMLSAVLQPQVVSRSASSVVVQWDIPDQPVDVYEAELLKGFSIFQQANVTANSIRFEGLEPSSNYSFRVIAYNKYGSSPPSLNITFETAPENDFSSRPQPPTRLRVAWNYGRRVNVTWDWNPVRSNGEAISELPTFSVFYVLSGENSKWISATTYDRWFIMENLTRDSLYEVYVYASDGKSNSRCSSIITILTSPDELSLPEPEITIIPYHVNHTYQRNQKINIKCLVNAGKSLNLDLQVGDSIIHNIPPRMDIETSLTVSEKVLPIVCSVTDTDGRQNRVRAQLFIQFGPEVSVPLDLVKAFDDLSAELRCTVRAFPQPHISWSYRQSSNSATETKLNETVTIKNIAPNLYESVLVIKNATGREGVYMCNAVSPNGSSSSRNVDLAVSSVVLPITPRFVLKCCSDSQISDSCQRACSVAPHYNQNCSEYSRELLKCASDGRDHRQCCVHAGVPLDCLPICKGVTTLNQPHCDAYATRAVACMIKGHEKAPNTPGPMFYTKLSPTTAKIFWNEPESNSYRIYALYYRKENDDDDFKIKKTVDNVVVLHDLDPDVSYNLALVAANAHGHSAFVELTVPSLGHDNRHGFVVVFGVIIVLLFVSAAVFATLRLRKGRSLPTVLRRFRRSSPLSSRDTTVAFENPGFGSEVQIRGLSQSDEPFNSDWQNTELEVPVSSNMRQNSEINNGGMRYAKLGPL